MARLVKCLCDANRIYRFTHTLKMRYYPVPVVPPLTHMGSNHPHGRGERLDGLSLIVIQNNLSRSAVCEAGKFYAKFYYNHSV